MITPEDKAKVDILSLHLEHLGVETKTDVLEGILKLEQVSDRIEVLSAQFWPRVSGFVVSYRQTIIDLIDRVENAGGPKNLEYVLAAIETLYIQLGVKLSEPIEKIRRLEREAGRSYSKSEVLKLNNDINNLLSIFQDRHRGRLAKDAQTVKNYYETGLKILAKRINGRTSLGAILHMNNFEAGIIGFFPLCEVTKKAISSIITSYDFKRSIHEKPLSNYHQELIHKNLKVDLREALATVSKEDREELITAFVDTSKFFKAVIDDFKIVHENLSEMIPEEDDKTKEIFEEVGAEINAISLILEKPHLYEMESQGLYYSLLISLLTLLMNQMKPVLQNPKPQNFRLLLPRMAEAREALRLFQEFQYVAGGIQKTIMDNELHGELLIFPPFEEVFSQKNLKPFDLEKKDAINLNTMKNIIEEFRITYKFILDKILSGKSLNTMVEEIAESLVKLAQVKKQLLHKPAKKRRK
ncbi:MAG: hypothetical protein ACFFDI_17590 [Promethearchaeota archaeon]